MGAVKDVRSQMIRGAVRLLAQRGLQGTSFAEILELTGAPRGSVYHHFPGGKDELVGSALDAVSDATRRRIEEFERSPVAITEGFLALWRELLDSTRLTTGCAVVAVSVAASGDLLDRAGRVFRDWTNDLAGVLVDAGVGPAEATGFATVLISATEGAVIMSRARQSREPFDQVADTLLAQARRLA